MGLLFPTGGVPSNPILMEFSRADWNRSIYSGTEEYQYLVQKFSQPGLCYWPELGGCVGEHLETLYKGYLYASSKGI